MIEELSRLIQSPDHDWRRFLAGLLPMLYPLRSPDEISGSAGFGQVVRSAIGFAADREAEDGSCVLSLIKTNIAPSDLPSNR